MLRIDAMNTPACNQGRVTAMIAGLAALLLWISLALPIVSGRVFHADDLGRFHLPLRLFYAKCLALGDDYRWHPGLYCGFYVQGEGQAGMEHPVHQALYRGLAPSTAFQAEIVYGYPVMFVGMMLWLRRLQVRWDAAVLGAIMFAFSPFNLLRYVHLNAVQVIAHLPWLLLAIEILARPRNPHESVSAATGVALLTASQCLLGYPQYLGFSILVEASYAVCRIGRSRGGWSRFLLAMGLGLIAGGRQLVPHWDAFQDSYRHAPSMGFVGIDSLHPMNLAQIVCPELFKVGHYREDGPGTWPRHERVAYLGAIVPASLAWLWIRRKELGRFRAVVLWALSLGSVSLLLAMGRYSPLFSIYAKLPLAGVFRATNRFVVITQVAASTLAAIALSDLASISMCREKYRLRSLLPLAVPGLLSLAVSLTIKLFAMIAPASFASDQIDALRGIVASFVWIAVPALLFAMQARGRRWGIAGIILVAAVDPAIHVLKPILEHDRPAKIEALIGPQPPSEKNARVLGALNASTPNGTRLMEGYLALTPRRSLDPRDSTTLRVAGVSWELTSKGWQPLPAPLDRARLVSRVVHSPDPRSDLRAIDPATTALGDEDRTFPGGSPGSAFIVVDRPGRIVIRTESPAERFFVISEAFHTGWRVAIDGQSAPFVRAYGDFLGCTIGAGEHVLSLRFDPASDRVGTILLLSGLLAIGLIHLAQRVRIDLDSHAA